MIIEVRHNLRETARPASLLITAARSWQAARCAGRPPQPDLASALATDDCMILAPVLDSLFRLYEAVLHRPIEIGAASLSADERLLLDLID